MNYCLPYAIFLLGAPENGNSRKFYSTLESASSITSLLIVIPYFRAALILTPVDGLNGLKIGISESAFPESRLGITISCAASSAYHYGKLEPWPMELINNPLNECHISVTMQVSWLKRDSGYLAAEYRDEEFD